MTRLAASLLAALGTACAATTPAPAPPTTSSSAWPAMEQALAAIAAREDGVVGAAVIDVASGRSAVVHGGDRFLMASVYKLPIALALLDAAQHGHLDLTEAIAITKADVSPGAQPPLGGAFSGATLSMPLARLMELMVGNSDNTATDVVLRRLGGPPTVGAYLRRVGHGDIRVDRDTKTLYAPPGPQDPMVGHDPRDTTTPLAMARLLADLSRGQLLDQTGRARLLGIMTDSQNQAHRMRRHLPPGTPVAHKSGTAGGLATNMVGIVTLPPPRGPLAVAVFVSGSKRPRPQQEETIAQLTRAAYDEALH